MQEPLRHHPSELKSSGPQKRVDDLNKGPYGHKWKGCEVFKSHHAMLEASSQEKRPDAVIIGVPPLIHGRSALISGIIMNFRLSPATSDRAISQGVEHLLSGSLDVPQYAMELDLAKAGMHMLVEKPISMRPAEEVERLAQVPSKKIGSHRYKEFTYMSGCVTLQQNLGAGWYSVEGPLRHPFLLP